MPYTALLALLNDCLSLNTIFPSSLKVLFVIPPIFSRALVNVIVLKVDPGGYNPAVALFISGELSALPALAASIDAFKSLGLYVGLETMANTSPVLGFNATTAPLLLPRALYAACCITGSKVVTTPFPILSSSSFLSSNILFNLSILKSLIILEKLF